MPKKADQVVSIRVPSGVPEELRAFTGMAFSTLMRHMAVTLLARKKAEHAATLAAKETKEP
jgi:hypothetical protein